MDRHRSQNQTIQKLCIDRKIQNFQQLKKWDMQRARKLMIHRKIIDEFDESIQQKLVQSSAYIDVVRQFLSDLYTQKIKYELQTVNNPQTKIMNNLAGKSIHKVRARQLGRLYNLNNSYKGYRQLKTILSVGLEKIQNLLVESQKVIMEMRTRIQVKVVEIQNCNFLTLELCNNLVSAYNKQKTAKPFLNQNDMYRQQHQFIYQAFIQTQTQRQLGIQMVAYLEYVEELEKKKLLLIKEVIGSYLQGIKEENESQQQINSLRDILKKQTENKYIDECYSSEQLLTKSVIGQLSRMEGKHEKEITMKFIKLFLKKLQYNYFEFINYLILKEYKIFFKHYQELEQITTLITVDAFLNIYLSRKRLQINDNSQQNLSQQIDFSLKIDSSLVIERQGDINLLLQTKKIIRNQQFEGIQIIQLIFANQDQRQEFIEFIQKIMK